MNTLKLKNLSSLSDDELMKIQAEVESKLEQKRAELREMMKNRKMG